MDIKVKNGLIKAFCYLLSGGGLVAIIIFQYLTEKNPMPKGVKVTVPCLIGLLVAFLVYYKSIKEKIERKLIAVETAKELGQVGTTNSIVTNILETIGVVIPLLLIATIFVVGGNYLHEIGLILFEIVGLYTINIIGNISCDMNTKQDIKEKELKQAENLANAVANKLKRYE